MNDGCIDKLIEFINLRCIDELNLGTPDTSKRLVNMSTNMDLWFYNENPSQ